jgi:hypothetical protein
MVDKQGDEVPTSTMKDALDFYMKYGVYSYKHEEMPIGLPLAYKMENGKAKVRVGIHDRLPMHDRVWKEIQNFGTQGTSSIRGEATDTEKVCDKNNVCHNRIDKLDLWSVSWVGDTPANPEAKVTQVAMAKQVLKKEIEEMIEKIIVRRKGKYCLLARKDRKLLGCHDTKEGAIRQERAIQARRFSKMQGLNKQAGALMMKVRHLQVRKAVILNRMRLDVLIEKAPARRRPGRGRPPKTWFENCRMNARKLRTYGGTPQVFNERAFCAELWRNPGKFSGRGPRFSPSRVNDRSGFKLRDRIGSSGWNPKPQLRRGRKPPK